MISPAALLNPIRARRPFVDHLVRAVGRYQADTGERLAAGVTFYWFLSLFPILLVAIAILGFALGSDAHKQVADGLNGYLPQGVADTVGGVVSKSKGKAGIIGLVGTLLSGLGWIDALREAIRTVWHQNVVAGNFLTRKLIDIAILIGLFAVIGASVVVSGAATASRDAVLSFLGLTHTPGFGVLAQVIGYAIGGTVDVAVFLFLFSRLARVRSPLHRLLKGAIFGAVAFELVKYLGAFYVARTTSKGEATYGTFAVVVGLLLFLNLVSRVILLSAAFTVTAPYDSDVAPSGTASAEQARKAGIPEEFADNDPDDPPMIEQEGAPSPLRAAVQGRTPSQDEPEGREAVAAGASAPTSSSSNASAAGPDRAASARGPDAGVPGAGARPVLGAQGAAALQGAAAVQRAARVVSALMGAAVLGVLVHAARSLRGALRH